MSKKDTQNEGVGIISIVIMVILAVVGFYYFFSQPHPTNTNQGDAINVPIESPAPVNDTPEK